MGDGATDLKQREQLGEGICPLPAAAGGISQTEPLKPLPAGAHPRTPAKHALIILTAGQGVRRVSNSGMRDKYSFLGVTTGIQSGAPLMSEVAKAT